MPHALELPRVLCAIVPLMGGEGFSGFRGTIINELVALPFGRSVRSRGRLAGWCSRLKPGFAAIIGSLDDLPEPAAGLRGIQSIGIGGRSLEVVQLPTAKVGTMN